MPRSSLRIRVPFVDVDSSQRIHYTAWFRYMEFAEHQLMRDLDLPYATASELHRFNYPRVHLEADFHGAISYDDQLAVEAWVERVGTSSWTISFAAHHAPGTPAVQGTTDATDTKPLATGRMTIVCMDPATQRSAPLPTELRQILQRAQENL